MLAPLLPIKSFNILPRMDFWTETLWELAERVVPNRLFFTGAVGLVVAAVAGVASVAGVAGGAGPLVLPPAARLARAQPLEARPWYVSCITHHYVIAFHHSQFSTFCNITKNQHH